MLLKRLDSYAAFVRVESLTMFVGEQAISAFVLQKHMMIAILELLYQKKLSHSN